MAIKKIIGTNFDDFREFCKKDGDHPFLMLRKARLIPTSKFGLDDRFAQLKDKDINRFVIVYDRDLGRDFYAPKKFVEEIEKMLLHFYAGIVQNLTAYRKPAPKMETVSDAEQNTYTE